VQSKDVHDPEVRHAVLHPQRRKRTIDRIIQRSESVLGQRPPEHGLRTAERKFRAQSDLIQKEYESPAQKAPTGGIKKSQVGQETEKRPQRISILPKSII